MLNGAGTTETSNFNGERYGGTLFSSVDGMVLLSDTTGIEA